jgi:3-oxoacyl-[acyl-carrier-protein] synthase-3
VLTTTDQTTRTLATTGGVTVAGWGTAVPGRRVTNHDLARYLDTSDEWIVERSGIRERRWAGPGESTGPLSLAAARAALARAGVAPSDLDAVVVATATPETPMPATATQVAAALGTTAGAFDINAACAGFVYGLVTAAGLTAAGVARTALVVGADTMSSIVDADDRSTAVLFGDGAGAVVLTGGPAGPVGGGGPAGTGSPVANPTAAGSAIGARGVTATAAAPGLVACDLVGDPAGVDLLVVPAGGSGRPASAETVAAGQHHLRMDGREVFRRAVRGVEASISRTLARAGCTAGDVALFVPHQANTRIVDAVLARTGLAPERTWSNIDRYGNTSAASIPIALAEAADAGTVADGDLVLMSGFGAGITVGTVLWRWCASTPFAPFAKDQR